MKTQALINLLEFTLASYEKLASEKRSKTGELNRHEEILKKAFLPVATLIPYTFYDMRTQGNSRLSQVLYYMGCGDTPEEALHRYFLLVRHGTPTNRTASL
jgi:hypothetical protein